MESCIGRELKSLREEGFAGVVFGDIHLADVREWYETRVVAAGLEHVEPIWGERPPALLAEFISTGGRAVLTCVELAKLDESWLGRVTDGQFATDIQKGGVDACGENGEYHSFAFDGPVFSQPVRWAAGERRVDGGFAQLDIS
jgi:diphthamide synthase (EF-2-diphthine--ammonia ligase)